ncbi:MAG: hypothetical protein KDJ99_33510 [Candidatus Competibacteraceae bacterium]|nr:hypothetical protein [Candidatus Competibacteraceae bacterium]
MARLQEIVLSNFDSVIVYQHDYGDTIEAWFEFYPGGHAFKINGETIVTPLTRWSWKDAVRSALKTCLPFLRRNDPPNPTAQQPVPRELALTIYKEAMEYLYSKGVGKIKIPGQYNEGFGDICLAADQENKPQFVSLDYT